MQGSAPFPSAVARNAVLPEFCCQHPLHSFGIQPAFLSKPGKKGGKNKTHDIHIPPQFYGDHYSGFDFSP